MAKDSKSKKSKKYTEDKKGKEVNKDMQGKKAETESTDTTSTIRNTIDSVLEKGVDFTIKVQKQNILHKLHILPTERQFVIYPLNMGTVLKISEILFDINTDELDEPLNNPDKEKDKQFNFLEAGVNQIIENKDKVIKIIAYGITNSKKEPSRQLVNFLDNNLNAKEGLKLVTLIVQQMNVSPFLASLVSLKGMNLMKMKKRETTPGE
ncbi:MAG: hypothetical protein WC057_05685 [Dehalococcoidales bacterium]|jgi:hypothetical protein